MYTGDQKSNKQTDQILSLLPSCRTHTSSYHLFNIREKHIPKVLCCFYRKLSWQIVNGTHQNPWAFNTEREKTALLNYFLAPERHHLSEVLETHDIFNIMLHSTSYNGKQYKVRALPPVVSNMLVSIIHTKWVVNCCTLSHKFYRSSSICWNVTYGQKSKAIKIKKQHYTKRALYKLLRNTGIKGHKWTGDKRNVRRSTQLVAFFISTNLEANKTQKMVSRNFIGNLALL